MIQFRKLFQYFTEKESDKMHDYATKIGFTLSPVFACDICISRRDFMNFVVSRRGPSACAQ